MMSIELVGSVIGAVVAAVWGYRDLRALYALLVTALIVNLRIPGDLLGVPVTTQRLVALASLGACALLFLQGRIVLPRPSSGQAWFLATYGLILVIDAFHYLVSPVGGGGSNLVSCLLNLFLFCLTLVVLANLEPHQRRVLFDVWLPGLISIVLAVFLGLWVHGMLERPTLDPLELHQGYRLRNVGERNIVNIWAASLVLATPLVLRPFLALDRLSRSVVSLVAVATISLAVLLTYSRAALLALLCLFAVAVILAAYDWTLRVRRRGRGASVRLGAALVGFLGACSVLTYAIERMGLPIVRWTIDRVQPVLTGTDPSVATRLDRFDQAWRLFDRLPLLGFGPDSGVMERLPENTFVLVTLHYGPVALASFCAMLGVIAWEVGGWWWRRRGEASAAALPAALVAYVLLLTTNDFLFFSMGTLVLATVTSLIAGGEGTDRPGSSRRG